MTPKKGAPGRSQALIVKPTYQAAIRRIARTRVGVKPDPQQMVDNALASLIWRYQSAGACSD